MKIKFVNRYDKCARILRLFRVVWHNEKPYEKIKGQWLSKKFSMALSPKLFNIQNKPDSFSICILGLRFHYKISYGGYLV